MNSYLKFLSRHRLFTIINIVGLGFFDGFVSHVIGIFVIKGDTLTQPRCTKGVQRFEG